MDLSQRDVQRALSRLVSDPDLEDLEARLGRCNTFEALGLVRRENKHSDFLAWLLDPTGTHGLGDDFLRLVVRYVAERALTLGLPGPTPFQADAWDYSDSEVRREWRRIDVFVRDDRNGFACVIENKVNIREHSGQLGRYRRTVETELPGHRARLYVLLSPDGAEPDEEGEPYVPLTYAELRPLLTRLLNRRREQMGARVEGLIDDYNEMLDRHFNDMSEIQKMCRTIYQQHRQALDLIYEHRPDDVEEMQADLVSLVEKDDDLIPENSSKTYIRFMPKEMDTFVPRSSPGWSDEGRMVLFELENFAGREPRVKLVLGQGPEAYRRAVYEMAAAQKGVFNSVRGRSLTPTWFKLAGYELSKGARTADPDERLELLQSGLDRFKRGPMKRIVEAFREADPSGRAGRD